MLIGISVAFMLWAIIFIVTIVYAVLTKRHYVNALMLVVLLVGMLLCGATYGALFDFAKWVIS